MKKTLYTLSRYIIPVITWFVLGFVFIHCCHSKPAAAQQLSSEPDSCPFLSTQCSPKPTHILLIGQDRRENESRSRSDCMILCSFHPENGTMTMTSFLRDLYVSIPGYSRNRLNAAYAFGGMDLIRKTFQENFGVAIDGCVEVDFAQFSQLVDLLGGITIVLRQDEAAHINMEVPGSSLSQGRQHLNGAQALAYSRIRSLDHDGDFSRTTRQRNVLMALLSHCRSASVSQLLRLFREASPMMHTDMGKGQLLSLIRQLGPLLSSMEVISQHIPAEGTYCHQIIDGMAVLVTDMEAARKLLRDSITGS